MKSALVVIDFQNDFISGSLGFKKAETLREPICARIQKALKEGEDLIFTMDTHDKKTYLSSKEGEKLPVIHCDKGSWGWNLDDGIKNFASFAKVFEKETFGSLDLANYLKEQNYERIELCGLVCSICVSSNAILAKAACPQAEIVVDSNLTEDSKEENKKMALDMLENVFVKVLGRKL